MNMFDRRAAVALATVLVAAPVAAAGPYPPYPTYPAPQPQSAYQSSYPSEYPYPPPPPRLIDPNPREVTEADVTRIYRAVLEAA